MNQQQAPTLQSIMTVAKILWIAFVASIVIYQFVENSIVVPETEPVGLFVPLLSVSLLIWLGAFFVPKFVLKNSVQLKNPQTDLESLQLAFPAWIIRLAMFEAPAITVIVLKSLGEYTPEVKLLYVLSALGLLSSFPNKDKWIQAVKELKKS